MEDLRSVVWRAFPFRDADESCSLEVAELISDELGVKLRLNAVAWADGPSIEDVRQQDVRLFFNEAQPVDSARVERYLAAVEQVVGKADRATWLRNDPASWFDARLLEGAEPSTEALIAALQPVPMAMRELIRWLSSGFEYGAPPASITLWDRRVMHWPPADTERELFLFRYEYANGARGVGLVGSPTFSMSTVNPDGSVEDALAAHCMNELRRKGDLSIGRKLLGFS